MHWLRPVRPHHLVARRSGSRKAACSRDRRKNPTVPRRQPAYPRMAKPSGPRRSAPEVESKDCVEHVFGECATLEPLRAWVQTALSRLVGWLPPKGGECRHLVYGRQSCTPVDSTIRASALDTVRALRAAKIASEHRRAAAVRLGDTPEKRLVPPPPLSGVIPPKVGGMAGIFPYSQV